MKTIEQASHTFAYDMAGHGYVYIESDLENAFVEGVKFAQEWISVKDELPEENTDVLVTCTNGKRTQYDVDYIFNGKWAYRTNVTYWRPIKRE